MSSQHPTTSPLSTDPMDASILKVIRDAVLDIDIYDTSENGLLLDNEGITVTSDTNNATEGFGNEAAFEDVTYNHQIEAVMKLQAINSEHKPVGVDLKALFFNDEKPAPDTGYLSSRINLPRVGAFIENRPKRKKLNDMQRQALLATASSSSGVTGIEGAPGTGKTETVKNIAGMMLDQGFKVMVTAPQYADVLTVYDSFSRSAAEESWLREEEYVHFTDACYRVTAAEKLVVQHTAATARNFEGNKIQLADDENTTMKANSILTDYARVAMQENSKPSVRKTFGYKLHIMIQLWATQSEHALYDRSRIYLQALQNLPHLEHKQQREVTRKIEDYKYNFGIYYLKNIVKVVFCANSSSAHDLLVAAFEPEELIIDETAQESFGGIATVCGAHCDSIKHITLAGDRKKGTGVYAANNSDFGDGMLSRNLFTEIADDPRKTHAFVALNNSHRSLKGLVEFTKQFYDGNLQADRFNGEIEHKLQNVLKSYWNSRLRPNIIGSRAQIAIDVAGKHTQESDTTTKANVEEAKAIAWTIRDMLSFEAPSKARRILPSDIGVVTPYTGQVFEIQHQLRSLKVDTSEIMIATTNHAQGKERNIIFFSAVISLGIPRVPATQQFPIGFVANPSNINISLSRARVGRYIFGGLRAMAQMAIDRHPATWKYKIFFGLVKQLLDNDNIVSAAEWEYTMQYCAAPALPAQSFARNREFKQLLAPRVVTSQDGNGKGKRRAGPQEGPNKRARK